MDDPFFFLRFTVPGAIKKEWIIHRLYPKSRWMIHSFLFGLLCLHIVENACDSRLRHLRHSLENIFSFFIKINLGSHRMAQQMPKVTNHKGFIRAIKKEWMIGFTLMVTDF
jgi:hypothetical protein